MYNKSWIADGSGRGHGSDGLTAAKAQAKGWPAHTANPIYLASQPASQPAVGQWQGNDDTDVSRGRILSARENVVGLSMKFVRQAAQLKQHLIHSSQSVFFIFFFLAQSPASADAADDVDSKNIPHAH